MSAPSPSAIANQEAEAAWLSFPLAQHEAIPRLLACGPGNPWRAEKGVGRSNLSLLLAHASKISESTDPNLADELEAALDLVQLCLREDGDEQGRKVPPAVMRATMRTVIRLTVISRMRALDTPHESRRRLPYAANHASEVLKHLVLLSSEIIHGRAVFDATRELAMDYTAHLPRHDPLVRAWQWRGSGSSDATKIDATAVPAHLASLSSAIDAAHPLASHSDTDTADSVEQPTPSASLNAPPPTSWNITAHDLLSLVAPSLLTTLQTAPEPPLGIPSTFTQFAAEGQTDASAYAGKVYSSHEFRNRETSMPSGLGSGASSVAGATVMGNTPSGGGVSILSGGTRLGLDPRDPRAGSQRYGYGGPTFAGNGMLGYAGVGYGGYGGFAGAVYGSGAQAGMIPVTGTGLPGMSGVAGIPAFGGGEQGLTPTATGASRPASCHVDEWSK